MLTLHDLLVRGKLEREDQFNGALAHETVYLCYSSGTTGKPKVNSYYYLAKFSNCRHEKSQGVEVNLYLLREFAVVGVDPNAGDTPKHDDNHGCHDH
jgi:non-ribosomal peptide synthetase component F